MTAFLKFANLADVVLVEDPAAVQRRRIWRILRGFFNLVRPHSPLVRNLAFQGAKHVLSNPFSGDRSINR